MGSESAQLLGTVAGRNDNHENPVERKTEHPGGLVQLEAGLHLTIQQMVRCRHARLRAAAQRVGVEYR
ncbi:MAG TPA: hypothetical protein VGN81_40670 [Pseudonocardiaceae bacterium]